jgi:hypothetical protein
MKKVFRSIFFFGFSAFLASAFAQACDSVAPQGLTRKDAPPLPLAKCLPAGIKLTAIVETAGSHKITVEQKLNALKATCNNENKLLDGKGRQIVFYHLMGCWGYPPPNYRELLQKQRREIARLKEQHTVIEMTCNPSGVEIP